MDSQSKTSLQRFEVGDLVSTAIPISTATGAPRRKREGRVIEVFKDDRGKLTGNPRDSFLYRVALLEGKKIDFRGSDIDKVEKDD